MRVLNDSIIIRFSSEQWASKHLLGSGETLSGRYSGLYWARRDTSNF